MKEFKFDHANKVWDRYHAFHNNDWAMVEFETGEVMVRSCAKDFRQMYDKYGIQVVASTDKNCPPLFLDKECTEPCPKAWLTQNGFTPLAIDHEQKVAFQLHHPSYLSKQTNRSVSTKPSHLGSHVGSALAYWSGAGRMPIANGKTKIKRPNPEWRKKVLPVLLAEVIPAITAMHRLSPSKRWYDDGKYPAQESWLDSSASEIIDYILTTPTAYWKQELDDDDKKDITHKIATKGFSYPRSTSHVDFLYIKGEK